MAKDEMVGWYHRHESEEAPGDGGGQCSLACCSSWGHKKSDKTQQLNSNNPPPNSPPYRLPPNIEKNPYAVQQDLVGYPF